MKESSREVSEYKFLLNMFSIPKKHHLKPLSVAAVRSNSDIFFRCFGTTNEETFFMRRSALFCPIDKNLHPDDKMVKSNQLMLQAGLIAKVKP